VQLLTASSPLSVNAAVTPCTPLTSSDTTAGNRRTNMPTASSVVSRLSTSRVTITSYTATRRPSSSPAAAALACAAS
jgi:hypothetical protein